MTRTSPEPGHSDPRRHATRQRSTSLRRRGVVTACAIGVSLFMLPVSAHAEPDLSEQKLQTKVDKLTEKAEILTEKFNGRRLELKKAKEAARQTEKRADHLAQQLEQAREAIAELAASRYKSGGFHQSLAFVGAENPEDLVDRATMLTHLSRQKTAQLQDLQSRVEKAEKAERKAEKAAAKVKKITEELQEKKDNIEDLVSEAKQKLAELEAQQEQSEQSGQSQQEQQGQAGHDDSSDPVNVDVVGSGTAAQAAEAALAQQGDPYVWGAAGPDAFDCSGLVVYAYAQVGISLPHYTGALVNAGTSVSRAELRPGDLVFTSSHHVGIYVGGGKMVNAPHSGTVVQVESIEGESLYAAVRITQ